MKKILGIDPGLCYTGLALIHMQSQTSWTVIRTVLIKTKSTQQMHERLHHIYTIVKQESDASQAEVVCIEDSFVNSNPRTSLHLAAARGAILAAVGSLPGIRVQIVTPNQAKKAITGYGRACKSSMQQLQEVSSHENDAIAIAITGGIMDQSLLKGLC